MFLITLYDCDEQASLDRDAQSEHRRKKIEALKVSEISVPIYPLPTELTEKQVVLVQDAPGVCLTTPAFNFQLLIQSPA